jgi:hypothetical protein
MRICGFEPLAGAGVPPPRVFLQKSAQSKENKWFARKSKLERVKKSAEEIENTGVICASICDASLQVGGNKRVSFAQLSFLALRSVQSTLFGHRKENGRERSLWRAVHSFPDRSGHDGDGAEQGRTETPVPAFAGPSAGRRLAPCGARSGLASLVGCEAYSKSCCDSTPSYSTNVGGCQ